MGINLVMESPKPFVAISKCLASSNEGHLTFFCDGCNMPHTLQIGAGSGPRWGYNGNAESPAFTPSVLVRWREGIDEKVCHSFVTDGRIQYLNDSTHKLSGQTVDLPDWEKSWNAW